MDIKRFNEYDSFQIIFPRFQDYELRNFAHSLKNFIGKDAKLSLKATYDYKKLSLKDKDIDFIELKNTKNGLLGLMMCLLKFEELIEIKMIKNIHKFEIPKKIRDLYDEFTIEFEELYDKRIKKDKRKKIKIKENNFKIYKRLKEIKEPDD